MITHKATGDPIVDSLWFEKNKNPTLESGGQYHEFKEDQSPCITVQPAIFSMKLLELKLFTQYYNISMFISPSATEIKSKAELQNDLKKLYDELSRNK